MIKNLFDGKIGDKVIYPLRLYIGEIVESRDSKNPTLGIIWEHEFVNNEDGGKIQYVSYSEYMSSTSWQEVLCCENDKDLLQIKLKFL